ncbi:MAG TPA: diguanylate cyclase, partial [Candidatus Obscuribacterales bacterium]
MTPPTLLLIDDKPTNLDVLSQVLVKEGYRVLSKKSGLSGIEQAGRSLPDLILLDVMMPGMDGYETCRRLKADARTAAIPVIFMSALSQTDDKILGFAAGGVDYITKPFQVEEVQARVHNQLTLTRYKSELEAQNLRLEAEIRERRQTQALLHNILEISRDGIAVAEPVRPDDQPVGLDSARDYAWTLANPVMHRLLGQAQLLGRPLAETLPQALQQALDELFTRVLTQTGHQQREIFLEAGPLPGWYQISALSMEQGISLTFRDITALKEMALTMEKEARQDGLTQLANRRCFDETLAREWEYCARNRLPLALLMCDVDHFKAYNDSYGHSLGDACLVQVARGILQAIRRPTDLAARYGGEEFAV